MPYLALILLFVVFFKSLSYGIFEIKQKQNKPGGVTVLLLAILRTYFPKCGYFGNVCH